MYSEIKDKTKLTLDLVLFQERPRRKQSLSTMLGELVKILAQGNNVCISLVKYNVIGTKGTENAAHVCLIRCSFLQSSNSRRDRGSLIDNQL